MNMRFNGVLLSAVILTACAHQAVEVKSASLANNQIQLCTQFEPEIQTVDREAIKQGVNTFISEYNKQRDILRLQTCETSDQQSLTMHVKKVKHVSPLGQIIYTTISAAGIAYPVSGGSFGWVLLGTNSTDTEISLSSDISNINVPIKRTVYSLPFYGSLETQRQRQVHSIQEMLTKVMQEVDKSNRIVGKG